MAERLADELREAVQSLRRTPLPIADVAPLLQRGADGLDVAETRFRMLVHEMRNVSSEMGIYPQAIKGHGDERDYTERDGYKNGWNAAVMEYGTALAEAAARAASSADEDLLLLLDADVGWITDGKFRLNMNDTWGWAIADSELVPPEKMREVATLFRRYGEPGLFYWVSEQRERLASEFHHINRFIEFVRREEELRIAEPNDAKRAYKKVSYTIGAE